MTDDDWYVVKWKQNSQHRRVLINEVIGAELLRRLGIATPNWAMVHVDRDFLRASPEARVVLKNKSIRVRTGWHFGSKVPVNPEKQGIYDFLPAGLITQIINLNDFLRVLIFDLWVDNSDSRQAIFFGIPGRRFAAQMIDNGHAFGFTGVEWRMRDRFILKQCGWLRGIYLQTDAVEQFEAATTSIQEMAARGFDSIQQLLPTDWIEDDHETITRLFEELCRRAKRMPELVARLLAMI